MVKYLINQNVEFAIENLNPQLLAVSKIIKEPAKT